MKIILVRHGRPDEHDVHRPSDPPLNAEGRRQADAAASLLKRESISRIVASPLLRARQTAQPLAEALGLPIDIVDGWAEADRNATRYRSTETLRALGAEEWRRFLADPIRYLGSDPDRFQADVLGALAALSPESGAEQSVAVFTHGMPINVVLSHVLSLTGFAHFLPGYGSITRLRRHDDGGLGVVSVNESGHHVLVGSTS